MTNLRSAISIVTLFVYVAIAQTTSIAPGDAATKTVTSGKFTFSYTIDGTNLVAKISCPSQGWIAVGFNPKTVMKNAFCVMGVLDNGKPVVSEEFGTGMFEHKSIQSLGGKSALIASDVTTENGIVTLTFTMPLSTKDGMHADLAVGKKVKLIFASGGSGDLMKKHKKKAMVSIIL